MKTFFKYIFLIFIVFISIYILLLFVKYPDRTSDIKPIALKILDNKQQTFENSTNAVLSNSEIIELLQKSGCQKVYNIESLIFKTDDSHKEYWYHAFCMSKNSALEIQMSIRDKDLYGLTIRLDHSYCHYDEMTQSIRCFTESIADIPSR